MQEKDRFPASLWPPANPIV